jgi:hypothetical protein
VVIAALELASMWMGDTETLHLAAIQASIVTGMAGEAPGRGAGAGR